MTKLDVNGQFVLPVLAETISNLSTKQKDEVIKSRLETIALLLNHIENDKMWDAIVPMVTIT